MAAFAKSVAKMSTKAVLQAKVMESTKVKLAKKAIKLIEKRLAEIQFILFDFNYVDASKKLYNWFFSLPNEEQCKKFDVFRKKKHKIDKLFEMSTNSIALIEEKVRLEFELIALNNELYYENQKTATQRFIDSKPIRK